MRLSVGALAIVLLTPVAAIAQTSDWATRPNQMQERRNETVRVSSGRGIRVMQGRIAVPENRAVRGSRLIDVHFVRLSGEGPRGGDPTVFLAGGPGDLATPLAGDSAQVERWLPILEIGDVLLVDQRGTRDPALRWAFEGSIPRNVLASVDTARAHWTAMSRAAGAAFATRGVDIRGYTTVESAADLEALRGALAIPRLNLLGFSYGTHLALAYLRAHGEHVTRAVLVGTEGPDHTLKLPTTCDEQIGRIADAVARDPRVRDSVGDFRALLERVGRKLDQSPIAVTVTDPRTGAVLTLPVGRFGLHLLLRLDLGDASDIPVFPRLLHGIENGDPSVLQWFVERRLAALFGIQGMSVAMDVASGASKERLARIQAQAATSRFTDVVNFPYPVAGAGWNVPDLGAAFRAPVQTPVPGLFLSGEYDWNAPPAQADEVRRGFATSTHLVVSGAGHPQILSPRTHAMSTIAEFLLGEDVSDRRLAYPPPQFVPLRGESAPAAHPSLMARPAPSATPASANLSRDLSAFSGTWDLDVRSSLGSSRVQLEVRKAGANWTVGWQGPRGIASTENARIESDSLRFEIRAQDQTGQALVMRVTLGKRETAGLGGHMAIGTTTRASIAGVRAR